MKPGITAQPKSGPLHRFLSLIKPLRVPIALALILAAWPLVLPLAWLATVAGFVVLVVQHQRTQGTQPRGTRVGKPADLVNSGRAPTNRPRTLYGELLGQRTSVETLIETAIQDELKAYGLSDTPGNREILQMWHEYEAPRRKRMASARSSALSALHGVGFLQPLPGSKQEEEEIAEEMMDLWLNSGGISDWDVANFREWLLANGIEGDAGSESGCSNK